MSFKAWHFIAALVGVPVIAGSMLPAESRISAATVRQVDAELAVKALLRDPDSATFQHLKIGQCGRVSARNGFGGMMAQRFVINGSSAVLEEQGGAFARVWAENCAA